MRNTVGRHCNRLHVILFLALGLLSGRLLAGEWQVWAPFSEPSPPCVLTVGEEVNIWLSGYNASSVSYSVERVTGLPSGLSFVNDDWCYPEGTCTIGMDIIEGTPTRAGTYTVTFSSSQYRNGTTHRTVTRTLVVREKQPNYVTVTFNATGGSVSPNTQRYVEGSTYGSFPTPTRSGYVFDHWSSDRDGWYWIETSDTVKSSVQTLYAQWIVEPPYVWVGNTKWYYDTEQGLMRLTGCSPAPTGHVNIPSAIGGTAVKGIGFGPCYESGPVPLDFSRATSFSFPDSLIYLDRSDFEVTPFWNAFSGSVVTAGDWAIGVKSYASDLTVPVGIRKIAVNFAHDPDERSSLRSVSLPDGLTHICSQAFWGQTKLTNVRIPASVVSVGAYAFDEVAGPFYFCGNQPEVTNCEGGPGTEDDEVFGYGSSAVVYFKSGTKGWTNGGRWSGATTYLWPTVTVRFDAGGGSCSESSRTYDVDDRYGMLPTPQWAGHAFEGWYTSPNGGTRITDSSIVPRTAQTLSAHWSVIYCWLAFDANGGTTPETQRSIPYGEAVGTLPVPTRTGYSFTGWFSSRSGGSPIDRWASLTSARTVYAQWRANRYYVRFAANGGMGSMSDQAFSYDEGQALASNRFAREGFVFAGWESRFGGVRNVFRDGAWLRNLTATDGAVVELRALWRRSDSLYGASDLLETQPSVQSAAQQYDGCLYDGNGMLGGTIQVKLAKAKSGSSKLTASIQLGARKVSLSGAYRPGDGEQQWTAKDGRVLSLTIGENGLSGSFAEYYVDGARNVFAARDLVSNARTAAAESAYVGIYNVMAEEGVFTVSVARKGKVKVSGMTVDGRKASASPRLLVGADRARVPVVVQKLDLAFVVTLKDGEVGVEGLTSAKAGAVGVLSGGSRFRCDFETLSAVLGDATYADYFPTDVSVEQAGSRWIVAGGAKAGKVTVKKDGSIDEEKAGSNPSGLKLKFAAKTGSFTGSFKGYVNANGKPKAVTVSVTGVMIDGKGYGMATVKGVGSWPVTIE